MHCATHFFELTNLIFIAALGNGIQVGQNVSAPALTRVSKMVWIRTLPLTIAFFQHTATKDQTHLRTTH